MSGLFLVFGPRGCGSFLRKSHLSVSWSHVWAVLCKTAQTIAFRENLDFRHSRFPSHRKGHFWGGHVPGGEPFWPTCGWVHCVLFTRGGRLHSPPQWVTKRCYAALWQITLGTCSFLLLATRVSGSIHRVTWRHITCGHDTIAILWV